MGKRNHRSRLAEVGGVGTWKWRGLPDGRTQGTGQGNKYLDSAPSFQSFARTSCGQMQQNLEGREAHFQSPHRLAIQDGEWVERDPDIWSYCNLFNQSYFEGHLSFCSSPVTNNAVVNPIYIFAFKRENI